MMKINTSLCKYAAVRRAAKECGWLDVSDDDDSSAWHIFWTDMSINHARAAALLPMQKINHFVGMTLICRKGPAAALLNRAAAQAPLEYRFFPRSWTLPRDFAVLYREMHSLVRDGIVLIMKPNAGSQGNGISLCRTVDELEALGRQGGVAQEYVDRPLLVDGYKFDLRLYVLVTSCTPLRIHLYRDGIARLCTEKYRAASSTSDEPRHLSAAAGVAAADSANDWRKRHLTNYAINKSHTNFVAGEGGSKRRLGDVSSCGSSTHHLAHTRPCELRIASSSYEIGCLADLGLLVIDRSAS